MVLLDVTAETWIITGLGFGIVLALLFFLVFVLQGFGWIMKKATAPKAPEAPKAAEPAQAPKPAAGAPSEPEKAAIAMSLAQAGDEDIAAVAYALYLAHHSQHDIPTGMIHLNQHETAWNTKSIGMNNVGF